MSGLVPDRFQDIVRSPEVGTYRLTDDGTFPNNDALPLLVYRGAFDLPHPTPPPVERVLESHQWTGAWRNGIYRYHHYHSTAHEVLAMVRGMARVLMGGDHGETLQTEAGDVLILPAGVAHKNVGKNVGSGDFLVVGAYPEGQQWDMNYGDPGERPQADRNIKQVSLPEMDPVYGENGPLMEHWNA